MPTLKVDESIFTGHFFVKMHLCGIDFNSTLMARAYYGLETQKRVTIQQKKLDADTKTKTNILNKQKK